MGGRLLGNGNTELWLEGYGCRQLLYPLTTLLSHPTLTGSPLAVITEILHAFILSNPLLFVGLGFPYVMFVSNRLTGYPISSLKKPRTYQTGGVAAY